MKNIKKIASEIVANKLDTKQQNKSGDLYQRISGDLGQVNEQWDKINRAKPNLTFGEEFNDKDIVKLKTELKNLQGTLRSVSAGIDYLIDFITLDIKKGLLYAIVQHVSSGTIASYTGLKKYKDIDGVVNAAVQILQRDGDKEYSLKNLKEVLLEAKDEYLENKQRERSKD